MRRRQASTYALTVTLILATTALSQTDNTNTYPVCWNSCAETQKPSCSDTDRNIACICHLISEPTLQDSFLYCLERNCLTDDLLSPFSNLSTTCSDPRAPIPSSVAASISAAVATADISDDFPTATSLSRPHGSLKSSRSAESAASEASVSEFTNAQVSEGSTVTVVSGISSVAGAIVTATATATASRGSGTPKTSQNGGTVLDQAGSGESRVRVGSLWVLGGVLGVAWFGW
ncbi:hypothetical protein N7G274_004568 [Stereocaulon virgatum]|uniref:Extracellular membrane protein CFEM domain-containing protein n=1 Tax=Stereocaulon virgatum TaxID=373712 RepID=A0ABR4AA97_9LECA